MTQSRYKAFKANLLKVKGTQEEKQYINDVCHMGYLWLEALTNNYQIDGWYEMDMNSLITEI